MTVSEFITTVSLGNAPTSRAADSVSNEWYGNHGLAASRCPSTPRVAHASRSSSNSPRVAFGRNPSELPAKYATSGYRPP